MSYSIKFVRMGLFEFWKGVKELGENVVITGYAKEGWSICDNCTSEPYDVRLDCILSTIWLLLRMQPSASLLT